eukprot:1358266-Amorphochlora_amoeboformis.AAC.1
MEPTKAMKATEPMEGTEGTNLSWSIARNPVGYPAGYLAGCTPGNPRGFGGGYGGRYGGELLSFEPWV